MVVVNLGKKHHRMWKLEKKHEVRDRILHGLKVPAHKILVHIFFKSNLQWKNLIDTQEEKNSEMFWIKLQWGGEWSRWEWLAS